MRRSSAVELATCLQDKDIRRVENKDQESVRKYQEAGMLALLEELVRQVRNARHAYLFYRPRPRS